MDTHKAIAELARWAAAAATGNSNEAQQRLRQFYHVGSSLVASKEFQAHWQARHHARLEPAQLEDACKLLGAIAEVESIQLALIGKAAA